MLAICRFFVVMCMQIERRHPSGILPLHNFSKIDIEIIEEA